MGRRPFTDIRRGDRSDGEDAVVYDALNQLLGGPSGDSEVHCKDKAVTMRSQHDEEISI